MFRVLAAADLGTKVNIELAFPVVPTIPELTDEIVRVMSSEAVTRRSHAPAFVFNRAQVFDERMEMWVDLVASSQLEDYCQVYVFQKESQWHKENPGRIPPPISSKLNKEHVSRPAHMAESEAYFQQESVPRSAYDSRGPMHISGEVSQARAQSHSGSFVPHPDPRVPRAPVSQTYSNKVLRAYEELDARKTRAVTRDEWCDTFFHLRLIVPDALTDGTVQDLFERADSNKDGAVTLQEFSSFAEIYPKLIDCMYFRTNRISHESLREQRMQSQYDILDDLEKKLDDIRQATRDLEVAEMETRDMCVRKQEDLELSRQDETNAGNGKYDCGRQVEDMRTKLKEAKREQSSAAAACMKIENEKKAAERTTQAIKKKLRQQEIERDRTARETDRLRKLLEEQERELARKEEAITQTTIEIDESLDRFNEIGDPELEGNKEAADEEVSRVEEDLQIALQQEKELALEHRRLQDVIQKNSNDLKSSQQQQEAIAVKLAQQQSLEARALKAVDQHKSVIDNVQAVEQSEDQHRKEEEAKENDLVQMEIRLREQREAVERKEAVLRSAHLEFSEETGRTSPRREL